MNNHLGAQERKNIKYKSRFDEKTMACTSRRDIVCDNLPCLPKLLYFVNILEVNVCEPTILKMIVKKM